MKDSNRKVLNRSLKVTCLRTFHQRLVARCRRMLIQQDGIALVLALVSIMLLSMLGLYGAVGSQTDLRIAGNDQLSKRTWDIADAGIRHSFHILGEDDAANAWSNGFSDELSNNGVGGSLGSAGGTVQTIDGKPYVFFPFGGSNATDGYYVRAEDNFDDADQTTDGDQRVRIIARGQVGDAVKVIEALTVPPVKCALTANGETLLSGNSMSTNIQVNTLDGNGACVHTNDNLKIQGSVNFPDGASTSKNLTSCNGNPIIGSGSCDEVEEGTPIQYLPTINPGQWAQYVANLGIANPAGPYYILNSRNDLGNGGKITKGGRCRVTDPESVTSFDPAGASICSPSDTACGTSASTTPLGQCSGGKVIANAGATLAEYNNIAGGGAGGTIQLGVTSGEYWCKVKGLPAGIYYCDGKFDLTGPISGDVTLISRDGITMQSQSNFTAYFPKTTAYTAITNQTALDTEIASAGSLTNYKALMGNIPASYADKASLTNLGKQAYTMLSYFSLIAGRDIQMLGGTQITVQGIIFAHDEIYLSGNKDITGYIMAGSRKPTYPGDPNPPSGAVSGPGDGIEIDTLSGNVVLNYRPFATVFPLGPPKMIAWHDNMPKNY
jgi:hypothetical protein